MTRITVAILNYNGAALLPQFLPSVIRHSEGAEIVLIDNGSTDGSADWTEQQFTAIRLIRNGANLGFCSGYNEGLKSITADIVVLLNSDVEVTEGWLQQPVELFEKDASLFSVQPKILRHQDKGSFDYAGAGGGYIDTFGYPYCRGRLLDRLERDCGQYNDVKEVFWASGACMFVNLRLFRELGGFESSFFAHMEEIDLCWRALRNGYHQLYCGKSTVFHLGGGTLPMASPRKIYLNFRNNLSLLMRNAATMRLLWMLPLRFFLDMLATIVFMFRGSLASSANVLNAYLDFTLNLPTEIRKRISVRGAGYELGNLRGPVTSVILTRYFGL